MTDFLTIEGQGQLMKKKDIDYFKDFLTNRLEELLHQADNTVMGMTLPQRKFSGPH